MARPLRPPREKGRAHRGTDDRRISRRARGPAESGRASRPEHNEAVRSARVQPGKGGVVFCDVLILDRARRELSQRVRKIAEPS
jgi:hypothetical protein